MIGNDFLDLASSLFARNRSPDEALCRTIVSRAYYGAFHLARNYVVQLGFAETDSHRFLSDALSASGEPNVMRAGDFLRNLATARGRADYDLTKPHVIRQMQDATFLKSQIERATDVKNLLSLANSDEAKATARAGIHTFWGTTSGRSKN